MFRPSDYFGDFRQLSGAATGVGSTVVQILPADPYRVYLALTNGAGNNVSVSFDPAVTTTSSPYVVTGNRLLELWWERHGVFVTLAWYAVAAAPIPGSGNTIPWVTLQWQPSEV